MDRRTRKTKAAIKEAFFQLIKKKSITKITISEIAETADIGRGTFYTHYTDIYDLRTKITEEFIAELTLIFDSTYPREQTYDFKLFSKELVTYVADNKERFKILFDTQLNTDLSTQLKDLLIDRVISAEMIDSNDTKERVEVSFSVTGTIGVLHDWVEDKLDVDRKELIFILDNIMARL